MDKKEFLDILRSQLSGQMSEQQIARHIFSTTAVILKKGLQQATVSQKC